VDFTLSPREAAVLSEVSERAVKGAWELSRFRETDPGLAGACGIEVNALEARTILDGGAIGRLKAAAAASLSGRPTIVRGADLDQLSRLEGVLALGASRIQVKLAEIDAAEAASAGMAGRETAEKIGTLIGLATGAVGLWKSIF
jgi:hypothetical protein